MRMIDVVKKNAEWKKIQKITGLTSIDQKC